MKLSPVVAALITAIAAITPAYAVLSTRVPRAVPCRWNRQAPMPSKSPLPGIMAVPRAGANGAEAKTRGADTDNCTSSVNPYVSIARIMAPSSPSPVRPIIPKSPAHPPAAFVGVVTPKTGPCPEANAV